jgi:hypothetical protein
MQLLRATWPRVLSPPAQILDAPSRDSAVSEDTTTHSAKMEESSQEIDMALSPSLNGVGQAAFDTHMVDTDGMGSGAHQDSADLVGDAEYDELEYARWR